MTTRRIELDDDIEEEENLYTPDGYNLETGEYDPSRDAWYPDFKALYEAEKEVRKKFKI